MRKIVSLLVLVFSFFLFVAFTFSDSMNCKIISPEKALKKAEKIIKKEKTNYDKVLGPLFIHPQGESGSNYLVYFALRGAVVSECFVDGCGKKTSCYPMRTTTTDELWLTEAKVIETFKVEKKKEAIFVQFVSPLKLLTGELTPHLPAVWLIIDEDGNCYYMSIYGYVKTFSEMLEQRRKQEKNIKIIRDTLKIGK
jgi:hypothetical protein